MDDLISRRAAIDAVEDGCQEWKGIFQVCEANIKNLPSAQPEIICSEIPNSSDTISRQVAIDALDKIFDSIPMEQTTEILSFRRALRELPSAQPEQSEPEELDFAQPHKKIDVRLEIGQPDRSLWFRIGEVCVDESKGFISAGRAVEKIRELLREERWEE